MYYSVRRILTAALMLLPANVQAQEHAHPPETLRLMFGAQAIGLLTHASPATYRRDLTEAYITQPNLFAHAALLDGALTARATINFEGLTLERGELNAGAWGEGYIDRRHPHTYLHEALVTARTRVAGLDASITAGRGFAPFGSDDPMVRPFVKFPVNHHLAQVLERWTVIAAVRRGPLVLEAGLFNGDEPLGPDDVGQIDRFGDSWSTRLTIVPRQGLEISGSYAYVASPELAGGGGLDQAKLHAGLRFEHRLSETTGIYALVEAMRTAEVRFDERTGGNVDAYVFRGFLAEAELIHRGWRVASRFERATRPEEERTGDPFRSPRPHVDARIHGITRFTNVTLAAGRELAVHGIRFAPFVELVRSHAAPALEPGLPTPVELWGTDVLWNLSAGLRIGVGMDHGRMGRYGAAQLSR